MKVHWEKVYAAKEAEKQGWYEPHLRISVRWIEELQLAPEAPILDVGGGASTLVDDLLAAGHRAITVIDLSEAALALARSRLGSRGDEVTWLVGDITQAQLPAGQYAVWHDRAAFHFLTEPEQHGKYRGNLQHALRAGGTLILATFAEEAPPTCSGLPVQRFSPEGLRGVLGGEFELVGHEKELHVTPGGVEQMYLYTRFRKRI